MRPKLVVLAVLALVTVACADAPTGARSEPSGSGIVRPTGADQVVLRVALEGGFVTPETTFALMPSFSVMGDGTIIEPGAQDEIYPGQALPPLLARTISEDGIQAILGAAMDAGLDHDGTLGDLGSVGVSDMPTTVFTLSANGETHRVEAYALGMPGDQRPEGMSQGTWAARQALSSFMEQLGRLPAWLPEGSIGTDAPYDAPGAALLVRAYRGDPGLSQDPRRMAARNRAGRVRLGRSLRSGRPLRNGHGNRLGSPPARRTGCEHPDALDERREAVRDRLPAVAPRPARLLTEDRPRVRTSCHATG
jgi:hypothetical protein